jgi:hypothetical protein
MLSQSALTAAVSRVPPLSRPRRKNVPAGIVEELKPADIDSGAADAGKWHLVLEP